MRPALPEPIDEAQWRRLFRLGVVISPVLAVLNALSRFVFAPEDRGAHTLFLAINVPAHVGIVVASLWNLRGARSERARRASIALAIALLHWTSVSSMFMRETIPTGSIFVLIGIAFFRTALDGRLGLFGYASAALLQIGLWTLVWLRVLPFVSLSDHALDIGKALPGLWFALGWQLVVYTMAWVLSSVVANRFRALSYEIARERQNARRTIAETLVQAGRGRLTGQLLDGRYMMKELLGRGGMGEVYEAAHVDDARVVAVKVLFAHLDQPTVIERFRREAETVRRLTRACAAEVYESGVTEDGSQYIVMERLRGEDLAALLRRRGRLPVDEVARLLEGLGRALDDVHAQGIVHRDLKPSNGFLLDVNEVRLLDFGIARLLDTPSGATLTSESAVIGSPGYLAPEQARGAAAEIGPATDVFALGAIAYRAVTGQNAFPAGSAAEAIFAALNRQPPPPTAVCADLPSQLDAVLALALAKDPRSRYAQATELARDFALACRGELPASTVARADALAATPAVHPGIAAAAAALRKRS